ncbi:MAG: DNA polymerase III subunit epsilon [Gammaproteobacteria bacterium]|nr:MAG: DNA polymerase III subunit epsilon [Gammaproteobacteria bacterium]
MRQIVLDTETTGLDPGDGHRIIEIGCVELLDRKLTGNRYHQYLNPDRQIDAGAIEVHGITNESLVDKPHFSDITDEFMEFICGAELIIHNAPFDISFIDSELKRASSHWKKTGKHCTVLDTLPMARKMHPGQKNTLDALCKRYQVDNSQRELHGALLDAEILADVYLMMTGGQVSLSLGGMNDSGDIMHQEEVRRLEIEPGQLKVVRASSDEMDAHLARLDAIDEASDEQCVWRKLADQYP